MRPLVLAEEYGLYQGVVVVLAASSLGLQVAGYPWWLWVGALLLAAVTGVADVALGFRRIRRDQADDARAAEMLVNGVYRVAPGHRVVQDGDRVIVFEAVEDK